MGSNSGKTGKASAVDLFCGAGGLTHGLLQAGILVNAGVDINPTCRYPFEQNNDAQFIKRDVSDMEGSEVEQLYPKEGLKILVGCAPCQPFSPLNNGRDNKDDEKWGLINSFADLVTEIQPTIVSMENVPSLKSKDIFEDFVNMLESNGYRVWYDSVYGPDYGVPQQRRRLVLLASKLGEVELIPSTHEEYKTVRDAIGEVEEIESGERSEEDPLHEARDLSEKNLKRIRASEPGGTWEDWPEELKLACHKKDSGSTYKSVYGRMEWDKPSPTITTQCTNYGTGRFGHPEQDRSITLREAAILQTFPEDYLFIDPTEEYSRYKIAQLIGNAVPVRLGEVIGETILRHLRDHDAV